MGMCFKDKWPAPKEVVSEGFDWNTWPVPETTDTKEPLLCLNFKIQSRFIR